MSIDLELIFGLNEGSSACGFLTFFLIDFVFEVSLSKASPMLLAISREFLLRLGWWQKSSKPRGFLTFFTVVDIGFFVLVLDWQSISYWVDSRLSVATFSLSQSGDSTSNFLMNLGLSESGVDFLSVLAGVWVLAAVFAAFFCDWL